MFGPNQVGEVIIGSIAGGAVNVTAFITSSPTGSIQVFDASSGAADPAAKRPFKVYQATAGDAAKNLDYEFSDNIDPRYVEKVTARISSPEVQKVVTYTVGTATPNVTYVAEIRLYNDGGSLSPENFAVISGYYVSITGDTTTTIKDGLVLALQRTILKRGNSEFVVTSTGAATFTVAGKYQDVVPGKIIGKQIEFDANAKSFDNAFSLTAVPVNLGLITVATTTQPFPGIGTGKQVVNYEWFVKGYKYDPARQVGYPADFDTPYYGDKNAAFGYDTINIIYYSPRKETSLERQYKVLTIFCLKASAIDVAVATSLLTDIAVAVDTYAVVPAAPV